MKTLKFLAIFCLSALAFVGCEPDNNGGNDGSKGLLLVADKTTIYDNGTDGATFTLYYDGMTLKEGYELYIGEGEEMIAGNKFTSTTQGTFEVWAAYGALESNTVNINVVATPPAAPAAPEDTNPEKTNFKRRVFLTQFTGTGCQYCPLMMNALFTVSQSLRQDDFVLAAAHIGPFADNDPARLEESKTLDDAMKVNSYPEIVPDLNKDYKHDDKLPTHQDLVEAAIDNSMERVSVKGGIAVNSEYHAEEEYIVLNATVKAKETTEFRIGAWLLEDNISATQSVGSIKYEDGSVKKIEPVEGLENFNTHNNCVRIANSKITNTDFSGFYLGTIEAGKTASREFAFKLKPNGKGAYSTWNHDNLHLVVFISTKEGNKWLVNNVVKCPKDGSVDFEYEN